MAPRAGLPAAPALLTPGTRGLLLGARPRPGAPPPSFPHQAQSGLWHLHRARSRDAAGWLTPALAVAQGLSCDGGQLYTWGANAKGQLGHGDKCPGAIDAPVQVQALADSEVK